MIIRALASMLAVGLWVSTGWSQIYRLSLGPASGFAGAAEIEMRAPGTLIGDFDPVSNPNGTRTKPGLFGTFGATENLPVNITLAGKVGSRTPGSITTNTLGSFDIDVDVAAGTIAILDYQADLLGGSSLTIPAALRLTTEAFRTRNPTFTYLAGTFDVPIGTVVLTRLLARQTIGALPGVLTPSGTPGRYAFQVAVPIEIEVQARLEGEDLDLPPFPFVAMFSGVLTLENNQALLEADSELLFDETIEPNSPLPPIPVDLPTFGDPAKVILNLVLEQQTTFLAGTLTTVASGPRIASTLIAGRIILEDFGPTADQVGPVTFALRDVGSTIPRQTRTVSLRPDGTFRFHVPSGVLDVSVKVRHWLRRTRTLFALGASIPAEFVLVNGDVNGDNAVSVADFLLLRAAFGSSPGSAAWNPAADLDGSGSVNLADYLILRRNLGRSGNS